MGLRERKVNHLNQVIEEHGFGEMILDKAAIFEFLQVLREALERMERSPEKSLVIGVLIDEQVQSSIASGVFAARVTSVVGIDVVKLIPETKTYTGQQLINKIDSFMENFDV
jgi:serine phosphatase RsbU (regulator of sigma subunit)